MKKLLSMLSVLALAACAGFSGAPAASDDVLYNRYELESFNGEMIKGLTPDPVRQPRIEFTEGMRLNGTICNSFNGAAVVKDGRIAAPQMASTMMMCPDAALMQAERAFFKALGEGARIEQSGGKLAIVHGKNLFIFVRNDNR